MNKLLVVFLASALGFVSSGLSFSGELEGLAIAADHAFTDPFVPGNAVVPPGPLPAIVMTGDSAGAAEYKKLAAAFEKGTVPAKEDLAGWKAGKSFERDMPEYPGSLLLASGEMQAGTEQAKAYRIIPVELAASPDFFDTLTPEMNAGLAILIRERLSRWTVPVFTKAEATFEEVMPSYNKGFSRYAVRKAADGSLLARNTWKSDMAGYATEGVSYSCLKKNLTPVVPGVAKAGQYVRVSADINFSATAWLPPNGGYAAVTFTDWVTFRDASGRITSNQTFINVPFAAWMYPNQYISQTAHPTNIYVQFFKAGKFVGAAFMDGGISVNGWPGANSVMLTGRGPLGGSLFVENNP